MISDNDWRRIIHRLTLSRSDGLSERSSRCSAEQIKGILEDLELDPFEELPKDPDRALVDVCNALKSYGHRAMAWLYAIVLLDMEGQWYETLCDDLDSDRAKVAKRRWQMRLKEIVRLGR